MKKVYLFIVMALAPVCIGVEEWVALFNGEDFSGWTFDVLDDTSLESIWEVKDGVIQAAGAGKPRSVMRTENSYSNYILEFEWRWPGEPGNSGCLIHCATPRYRNVWPQCLEVQLHSGNAGDFILLGHTIEVEDIQIPKNYDRPWKQWLRYNLTDDSEKAPGEWNRMRIATKGNLVEVYVNGILVNRGWNGSEDSGSISFQAELADVQFRAIRIRDIDG